MKYFFSRLTLIVFSLNVVSVAYAANDQVPDKVQIGEWLTGRDGDLVLSNFNQAKQYCAERGQHLPSVLEMVRVAIDSGANGIVPDYIPHVSTGVTARNVDGTTLFFHWDWRGFKTPLSWPRLEYVERNYEILTSSEDSKDQMLFYKFSTLDGNFIEDYKSYGGTGYVFCIPGL